MALVIAKTDPNCATPRRSSTFIVEFRITGYKIKRNIDIAIEGPHADVVHRGHSRSRIRDLKVPADNGRRRRRRFRWASIASPTAACATACRHRGAQRALDMAAAHVTKRSTFGGCSPTARRCSSCSPMRQPAPASDGWCSSTSPQGRKRVSTSAGKLDGRGVLAHMVHKVIDTAIQLRGRRLGFSQLQTVRRSGHPVRSRRLVDGPDEVHRWRVGATSSGVSRTRPPPRRPRAATI